MPLISGAVGFPISEPISTTVIHTRTRTWNERKNQKKALTTPNIFNLRYLYFFLFFPLLAHYYYIIKSIINYWFAFSLPKNRDKNNVAEGLNLSEAKPLAVPCRKVGNNNNIHLLLFTNCHWSRNWYFVWVFDFIIIAFVFRNSVLWLVKEMHWEILSNNRRPTTKRSMNLNWRRRRLNLFMSSNRVLVLVDFVVRCDDVIS